MQTKKRPWSAQHIACFLIVNCFFRFNCSFNRPLFFNCKTYQLALYLKYLVLLYQNVLLFFTVENPKLWQPLFSDVLGRHFLLRHKKNITFFIKKIYHSHVKNRGAFRFLDLFSTTPTQKWGEGEGSKQPNMPPGKQFRLLLHVPNRVG